MDSGREGREERLAGARVLLVGASAGIGRASALLAAQEGARVVVAARRKERLETLVQEAGEDCFAVCCDVREPAECERVVRVALGALGGLDALVYAAGPGSPAGLEAADATLWNDTLATNLVGAALVTRAALPALRESEGRCLYFSAPAACEEPPRPGMAPYAASKIALERMISAWAWECPDVAFIRIRIGDALTEFTARWDPEQAAAFLQAWSDGGYLSAHPLRAEEVAARVLNLLADPDPPATVDLLPEAARSGHR